MSAYQTAREHVAQHQAEIIAREMIRHWTQRHVRGFLSRSRGLRGAGTPGGYGLRRMSQRRGLRYNSRRRGGVYHYN